MNIKLRLSFETLFNSVLPKIKETGASARDQIQETTRKQQH